MALRSTASHQFCDVGHWVWLAISDGASAEVEPAFRVALGFHPLGDGLPVVDFGLIHRGILGKDPRALTPGGCYPSSRSSARDCIKLETLIWTCLFG